MIIVFQNGKYKIYIMEWEKEMQYSIVIKGGLLGGGLFSNNLEY